MATIGGADFTNFRNVRVRGTVGNSSSAPGAIRIVATSGLESTLSVNTTYQDSDFKWNLPAKSGTFGVTGTITVGVEAVGALTVYSTNIVIPGIRAEDGFVATIQNSGGTTGAKGHLFLAGARPSNSGVALTFVNPLASATVQGEVLLAYTVVR